MNLTTPETLSAETVFHYRSRGFVHVPRVLSGEEVKELLAEARTQLGQEEKISWDQEDGNVMDWVPRPDQKSETLRRLALHPRITGIAERLADRKLRMFKSEIILKRTSGAAGTPLHYDEPVFPWSGGAPVTLTAWVALVDVPVERGCMSFVPGSHLSHDGTLFTEADGNPYVPRPELTWQPRVTVPLRAGDCTFHHARTVHMAGTNASGEERISVATVYMDADSVYQPSALSYGNNVEEMEPGERFADDRFPVVGLDQ